MMTSSSDDLLMTPHDGKAQEAAGETIELKEEEKKEVNEECYENTAFIGTPYQLLTTHTQKFYSWFSLVHDRKKTIPMEEFGEHVQRMHADRDKWFELEYNVSLKLLGQELHMWWLITFWCFHAGH